MPKMNTSRKVMEWFICFSVVNLMLGWLWFKKLKKSNEPCSYLKAAGMSSTYPKWNLRLLRLCVGMLLLHLQNFIWWVNSKPTLQEVCSVILLQIIHLQLHMKLSFHWYKSIVSKYLEVNTSVWATQKNTWAQQTRSNRADKLSHRTCQNIMKKWTFKNISLWTMQSIQIRKICSLVCMTYFVF